jgi:hypothetical protein
VKAEFPIMESTALKNTLVVVCTNLMVHPVIAPIGEELYVDQVFKNIRQI